MNSAKSTAQLCLASHSPRRRQLLEQLGVPFFVRAAGDEVEEAVVGAGRGREAETVALERARLKGLAVQKELLAEGIVCPVLSSDTVVHLDDQLLDKPQTHEEAMDFLQRLSGTTHGVVSAVWVLDGENHLSTWRRTHVRFAELDRQTMEAYVATGEPFDKAGGYGIQGVGGTLIESIEGCYFTVMGLPVRETALLLTEAKISWKLFKP